MKKLIILFLLFTALTSQAQITAENIISQTFHHYATLEGDRLYLFASDQLIANMRITYPVDIILPGKGDYIYDTYTDYLHKTNAESIKIDSVFHGPYVYMQRDTIFLLRTDYERIKIVVERPKPLIVVDNHIYEYDPTAPLPFRTREIEYVNGIKFYLN